MGKIHSRLFKKQHPSIQPTQEITAEPILKIEPKLPLFRLPQLALKNVIDLMDFPEQVSMSLCSRRANLIIKNLRHRPQTLEIWIYSESLVGVTTGFYKTLSSSRMFTLVLTAKKISPKLVTSETVSIGEHRVPIKLIKKQNWYLDTFWEDENFGLRVIGDYVCDLFRVDFSCIQIGKDHRRMFDWVNNRQCSVGRIRLQADSAKINDTDLAYILSKINTKQLLCWEIKLDFRIDKLNKKLEFLALHECNWFTMDNIMTVEAVQLYVENNKLTNKDVNTFLKHWVNGGSPSLKFLRICTGGVNQNRLLDGLWDHVILGDERKRMFMTTAGHEYCFYNIGIQRNDGTTASLFIGQTVISFGVWPDEIGRTFDSFV